MDYNTQNYWVFGLCPSSGILESRGEGVGRKQIQFPKQDRNCHTVINTWSWAPDWVRHQDILTD
jgi:hypothetical protein